MNQLSELITIATVSQEFRQKLLTNPNEALTLGYQGKKLEISDEDSEILFRANAKSLPELAEYILEQQQLSLPTPARLPKATVLIAPKYPVISTTIATQLNSHNFNVHARTLNALLEEHNDTDLVLLCPVFEIPPEITAKLMAKYKVALLTDIKNIIIPLSWIGNIALISIKENINKIIHTVTMMCEKNTLYSPHAARQLLKQIRSRPLLLTNKLTNREKEIYYLLNQPNKKIAKVLNISEKTVRYHIQKINEKIGFDCRADIF